jgi:hypothetical protein
MTQDEQITSLKKWVRQLNWCVLMMGIGVLGLGLRLIVLIQQESNLNAQTTERLRIAETWEQYWSQQMSEEASKPDNDLIAAIRRKGGRAKHYALRLGTTEARIIELIQESQGQVKRFSKGWLKIQEDFKAAA